MEQRLDRDAISVTPLAHTTDSAELANAIEPLVAAVHDLEERFDALAERVEAVRRADRRRKLETLVTDAGRRIYATIEAERQQHESDAFQRKLFGGRLPRSFRERIFGVPDEESKS
jgi:hypothetical protein